MLNSISFIHRTTCLDSIFFTLCHSYWETCRWACRPGVSAVAILCSSVIIHFLPVVGKAWWKFRLFKAHLSITCVRISYNDNPMRTLYLPISMYRKTCWLPTCIPHHGRGWQPPPPQTGRHSLPLPRFFWIPDPRKCCFRKLSGCRKFSTP